MAYLKRKPVSALEDDYDRLFPTANQAKGGVSDASDSTNQKLQMIRMREAAGSTTISGSNQNSNLGKSINSIKVERSQRFQDGESSDYFQKSKEKS